MLHLLVLGSALAVCVAASDAAAQSPTTCTTVDQCRELTTEAVAAQEYERAHDLAWRLFQLAGARDTNAMALLARTQSLSGRGDDAFVMLQRLAAAGAIVDDIETSDDFRRVREHVRWPQLLEAINRLRAGDASAPGSASTATTPMRKKTAPASEPAGPAAPATSPSPATAAPSLAGTATPPPSGATTATPPTPSPGAMAARPAAAPPAVDASIEVLAIPDGLPAPSVLAYDAVSARFIVADEHSDVLRVVSEASGNATNLVSAGWSGQSKVTAVAIDRRTGDMWVTAAGNTGAVLHRMQLVSGRLLQSITSSDEADGASFAALAIAAEGVYVLDAGTRRVLLLAPKSTSFRVAATLPDDVAVRSLVHANGALYVSHDAGLLRIDLGAKSSHPVNAGDTVEIDNLHALAWRDGALLAIQWRAAGTRVVRLRLNTRGTTATSLSVLDTAAATAAAAAGNAYYFVKGDRRERLAFRSVPLSP